MDLLELAEASRYVVVVAVLAYLGSWVAFCAEAGARSRISRARAESANAELSQPSEKLAELVAAGGSGGPATVGDGPAPGAGVSDTGVSDGDAGDSADSIAGANAMARVGRVVFVVATVILAAGVAMRAVGVGRVPWGNMYEFSITGAAVAAVVLIVLWRYYPTARAASVWAGLLIFISLGVAVTVLYVAPGPIVPALRSFWMVIHVGAAVTAFGLFTVGAALSALQIAAERAERHGVATGVLGALPDSGNLERLSYRLTAIAFPIWTIGPLILGAVWAEVSWGRYWGWDPKEVWALITWLAYAAFLHARATAGWKGTKASVVALLGYATLIFSYFGVNIFFNGLHSYGGV